MTKHVKHVMSFNMIGEQESQIATAGDAEIMKRNVKEIASKNEVSEPKVIRASIAKEFLKDK